MHRGSQPLRPYVHVHDDALGFAGDAGVAVGHGEGDHFVGTCYDGGKSVRCLELTLCDGFEDGWVIGAEVDEAVANAEFPEGLEEGVTGCVPGLMLLGSHSKRLIA